MNKRTKKILKSLPQQKAKREYLVYIEREVDRVVDQAVDVINNVYPILGKLINASAPKGKW